ncbi:MAG: hypothetical protein ACM3S1_14610 [Hyphomicrobiales bacterium]
MSHRFLRTVPVAAVLAVAAAVALFVFANNSGVSEPATSGTRASTTSDSQSFTRPSVARLSAFQREILSDGVVTDEELARAHGAQDASLAAGGYEVYRPATANARAAGAYGVKIPASAGANAQQFIEGCRDQFVSEVELTYAFQHAPSSAELGRERAAMVTCLEGHGFGGEMYDAVIAGGAASGSPGADTFAKCASEVAVQ